MKTRNKSIALVDYLQKRNFENSFIPNIEDCEVAILDPVSLISESDWRRFEEDVDVINRIYSQLFDDVVISKKKLVCFWPLSEQFGSDWFDLSTMCSLKDCELEVYKSAFFDVDGYGFNRDTLCAWKRFVYFLLESLLDDIKLNDDLEEIATLTLGRDSIVLFKLGEEGQTRFTYAICSGTDKNGQEEGRRLTSIENLLPEFDSFQNMLVELMNKKDLSSYQTNFIDPHLEKMFYRVMSTKIRAKNVVESWLETYSLN